MSTRDVVVHGHHLAFHVLPGALPALVLDAGGGADSSYWNSILPELAKRTGSEIITYDRAGYGASDEVPPPYRIDDAVSDLESGLVELGATHDLILIPHSYAGTIATYLAARHPNWISGAVLSIQMCQSSLRMRKMLTWGRYCNAWALKEQLSTRVSRHEP